MVDDNNRDNIINNIDSDDEIMLTTPPRESRKKRIKIKKSQNMLNNETFENGNTGGNSTEINKKNKIMKIFLIAIVSICAVVCLISAYKITESLISYFKAENIYGEIGLDINNILNQQQSNSSLNPSNGDTPQTNTNNVIWTRGDGLFNETNEPGSITSDESISEPYDSESWFVSEKIDSTDPVAPTETHFINDDTEPLDTMQNSNTSVETNTAEITTTYEPDSEPVETQENNISTNSQIFKEMKAYIISLQEKNPDIIGVIYIPINYYGEDQTISYPVVQGSDNSYYLSHDIYGNELKAGSIYADCMCERDVISNRNLVLYGHNMFSKTMFHYLISFMNKNVFMNTLIYIYTPDAVYVYEPFAVYTTNSDYLYCKTQFSTDSDFTEYLYNSQRMSVWNKYMYFNKSDKTITLSTCYGGSTTGRMAVHGILIRIEN